MIIYRIYNILRSTDNGIRMQTMRQQLQDLFTKLNERVSEINRERRQNSLRPVSKAKVQLLGQISLLAHNKVSLILSLAQTGDMDAFLTMDHIVKEELKR